MKRHGPAAGAESRPFALGPYTILERLGHGREAVVYRATDESGQVVALKVLPPARARDPMIVARFQREARLALRLKHPHIVQALQSGEIEGMPYLVMEYLAGKTLTDVLQKRGRLSPIQAVGLIVQALDGLQHLHECGLVHRNLEPSNLMLIPSVDSGQAEGGVAVAVKLLDIGLGRSLVEEDSEDELHLTQEGMLLGSPKYMAPEQARDAHAADIRSDLYSIGCILYHALAGQPPFPDSSPYGQVIRHATEPVRPLTEFDPTMPEPLQMIVNRLLTKEPNDRYPTPLEAANDLREFLASQVKTAVQSISPPPVEPVFPAADPNVLFDFHAAPEEAGEEWSADVELVPLPQEAESRRIGLAKPDLKESPFGLHRRDGLVLVLGAAGLLLAEAMGWLLAQWFSR